MRNSQVLLSRDDEEQVISDLVERLVSVHGDVKSLDEVIDELLNSADENKKRRFSTG